MVVVARAAEQAALRRLHEYEAALEEAEARIEAMEDAAAQLSPLRADREAAGEAHAVAAGQSTGTPRGLRSPGGSSSGKNGGGGGGGEGDAWLHPQTSASLSHFYSCVEGAGPDGRATVSVTEGGLSKPLSLTPQLLVAAAAAADTADDGGATRLEATPPLSSPSSAADSRCAAAAAPPLAPEGVGLPLPVPVASHPAAALGSSSLEVRHTAESGGSSFSCSPSQSGSRLPTPLTASLAALLTPRSLARRRSTVAGPGTAPLSTTLHNDSDRVRKGQRGTPNAEELLRFKCTLLELELQSKEKKHQEERERWASAVSSAAGVGTVMGEVEARVRQAHAASDKVKGLLHEMHRLWCTSLALEDACDEEEAAGGAGDAVGGDEAEGGGRGSSSGGSSCRRRPSPEPLREEALVRRQGSLGRLSTPSAALRLGSVEQSGRWGSRRSPTSAGTGREFFGIEGPITL